MRTWIGLGVLLVWGAVSMAQDEGGAYRQVRAAMHIHTEFSTGSQTLERVAGLAVQHGVDALFVTDDDLLRVEYGLPFLRELTGLGKTENGLFTSGRLGEYLEEIDRIDERYPELVLIDGVESAPFYYWEFDWGKRTLSFKGWNKHTIAIGLDQEGYANLPVIGGAGNWVWHWSSLLLLWPFCGLAYAWRWGRLHPRWLRRAVLVFSLLGLAENIPFKVPLVDAYNGDLGSAPYQNYIDYVNQHGGVAIWPHSEAASSIPPLDLGVVKVASVTPAHAEDLVLTHGYTAFAALYGDNITATEPGREWDRILGDYLRGERLRPVWGTGEIDYHDDVKGNRIDDILTVFWVQENNRKNLIEALRLGRFYAARGGDDQLVLERFEVEAGGEAALSGERVDSPGEATVRIALDKLDGSSEQVHLRLLRGARVVAEIHGETPLEFNHIDGDIQPGENTYYRLLAKSRSARLTSNPIFVRGVRGRGGR